MKESSSIPTLRKKRETNQVGEKKINNEPSDENEDTIEEKKKKIFQLQKKIAIFNRKDKKTTDKASWKRDDALKKINTPKRKTNDKQKADPAFLRSKKKVPLSDGEKETLKLKNKQTSLKKAALNNANRGILNLKSKKEHERKVVKVKKKTEQIFWKRPERVTSKPKIKSTSHKKAALKKANNGIFNLKRNSHKKVFHNDDHRIFWRREPLQDDDDDDEHHNDNRRVLHRRKRSHESGLINCPSGLIFCMETQMCTNDCGVSLSERLEFDDDDDDDVYDEDDEFFSDDDDRGGFTCPVGTVFCMSDMMCRQTCGMETMPRVKEDDFDLEALLEKDEEDSMCPKGKIIIDVKLKCA